MKEYFYRTCCVVSRVSDLEDLYSHDREIKACTFLKNVSLDGTDFAAKNIPPLDKDWHVRFYRSRWIGQPCYHMVHSQIDYIFTKQGCPAEQ